MREEFLTYKYRIDNIIRELERHIKTNIKHYYKFEVNDVLVDVVSENMYKVLEIKVDVSNFYNGDVDIYSKLESLRDHSIIYDKVLFNRLCTLKDFQTKNENYVECFKYISKECQHLISAYNKLKEDRNEV